jgi:hypothetical protein
MITMSVDEFEDLIRRSADRIVEHCDIDPAVAWDAAIIVLAEVGISPPRLSAFAAHPSGGQH